MEEQWLRLMIRHHRGAVPMADAAAERAASPETAAFAAKMSAGQQSEIDLMQRLLADRGLAAEGEGSHGRRRGPGIARRRGVARRPLTRRPATPLVRRRVSRR